MKRISAAFLGFLLGLAAFAAPQGGRLPLSEYVDIMQWQVLSPTGQIPEKEYLAVFTSSPTPEQIAELSAAGIDVVAVHERLGLLRGSIISFAVFAPGSEAFPWVSALLPALPNLTSTRRIPNFYAIDPPKMLEELGVSSLQREGLTGEGVKVGVLDVGFTGELGEELPPGQIHYLRVEVDDAGQGRLTEGYDQDPHGEACAEAIAKIAPKAELYLISAPGPLEKLHVFDLIKSGALELDVLSDSTFYFIPLDHMDGKGVLAQRAAEVAKSVPYFFAVGNMASCVATDRAMFRAVYSDHDTIPGHDFDPQATSEIDRNTLAIEVKPWEGDNPTLLVVLEWDGWPWQVKEDENAPWTKEDVIRIQDVDLAVYYQSRTGSITRIGVSDMNQFGAAGVPPIEYIKQEITEPGTYLIQVANVTDQHRISGVFTRPVEFHVCVYLMQGEVDLEHCTPDGSLLNIAAAENVVSVGAVGKTESGWCVMPFSGRGPTSDGRVKPELVAPNGYISEVLGGPFGGTSASAPVVAGVAALLSQAAPDISASDLVDVLLHGATALCDIGECNGPCLPGTHYNNLVGWGLVNAEASYRLIR